MKPVSMPTASLITLATGAKQLVVQEPLETTLWSLRSLSWLTPYPTVRPPPSAGADTSTRLAPAVRCAEAFSFDVKMPQHSIATSTPSSFHGSVAGSLMAVTLIALLPTLMVSPLTVTSPGKRPRTLSYDRRGA